MAILPAGHTEKQAPHPVQNGFSGKFILYDPVSKSDILKQPHV
jgi:hypothetical protein